jgi:7-keto-8-aminopelargonate synthetase-like enzyme
LIRFTGNDYLCLASDPRLLQVARDALAKYGLSTCASRVASGTCDLHLDFEEQIADFLGTEASVVVPSGSLVPVIFSEYYGSGRRRVLLDERVHASIRAGLVSRFSRVEEYRHLSVPDLKSALTASSEPALVITDGVFALSSQLAPLDEIAALCDAHRAELIIDDAHGVGVLGLEGRGSYSHVSSTRRLPSFVAVAGSMGKALGSTGGFFAGSAAHVRGVMESDCFAGATAIAPALAAGGSKALAILQSEPQLVETIRRNARRLHEIFSQKIPSICDDFPSVTLTFPDLKTASEFSQSAAAAGLRVPMYSYPGMKSKSWIRLTTNVQHDSSAFTLLEGVAEKFAGLWS